MSKTIFFIGILLFVLTLCFTKMNAQENNVQNQNLDARQQSLSAISVLTAIGNLGELYNQLNQGLDAGLTVNEIKEALVQLYAYCGFPRSLNVLNTFKSVLDQRKNRGINDKAGAAIVEENNVSDKYEQGRKVLEELTQTKQVKPAPGFGEFAPRVDIFLKEHLFADIFASNVLSFQQRELVTISALATISGVESQLNSHIGMGRNTGITQQQLLETCSIIERCVSRSQANIFRKLINEPVTPIIENDMLVRISEIEIFAEYLEEYKSILKDEAAESVRIEPRVIAIFPMYEQENPAQVKIVEIYANKEAYQFHLQTAHFQYYKTSTLKMIKSLKLKDMDNIDTKTMLLIFRKLK